MGTTSVEMVSFQVCGSIGTKKSEVRFQDRKFLEFFCGSTNALGDYEVVYSVWWLWFNSVEWGCGSAGNECGLHTSK